jgi:hypothetical protein
MVCRFEVKSSACCTAWLPCGPAPVRGCALRRAGLLRLACHASHADDTARQALGWHSAVLIVFTDVVPYLKYRTDYCI